MGQGWCRAPAPCSPRGGPCSPRVAGSSQNGDFPPKEHPGSEQVLDAPFKMTRKTCGFCCGFFLYLSVVPFMFAWFYHAFPTTVLILATLLLLCSFLPLSFNRGDIVVKSHVGPLLAAMMMIFYMLVLLGSIRNYYAHVSPMRALLLAREYKGVYPQLPSVAFADAAFIQFSGNTSVDVSKSASLKSLDSGFNTYCVAPIVNQANTGRVEFWAVGADCCGESGDKFDCDDSRDTTAKNAWVMKDPSDPLFDALGKYISPPIVRRDHFMKAISKAEHDRHLITGDDPLLVRWTSESLKDVIFKEWLLSCVNLLVATLVSGVMALALTKLGHKFGQLRKAHRWKVMGPDAANQDVSARLDEFLQGADVSIDTDRWKELHPPLSAVDTCIMSVLVPYLVLMLCVCLTSYSNCWQYGQIVADTFYILLSTLILALMATPGRIVNGMFIMMVAMVGLYIGHQNYEANMFQYCSIENRRTYTNVMANADSHDYQDAGILKFESQAHLSQNHSVGFLYKDVTYCIAPIIAYDSSCFEAKSKMHPVSAKKDEDEKDETDSDSEEEDEVSSKSTSAVTDEDTSTMTVLQRRRPIFLQLTSRMQAPLDVDNEDYTGTTQTYAEDSADDDTGAGGDKKDEALEDEKQEETPATTAVAPASCKKTTPTNVEFWAIGTNCCGARGDFNCDGGGDDDAKSGVIVRAVTNVPEELEQPDGERHLFKNALKQSVAAFNLPEPERPVFIRWGNDAEALQKDWKNKATGIVLLTALVGLLVLIVGGFSGHFYMKYLHAQEAKQQEKERQMRQPPPPAESPGMFSLGGIRDQLRV